MYTINRTRQGYPARRSLLFTKQPAVNNSATMNNTFLSTSDTGDRATYTTLTLSGVEVLTPAWKLNSNNLTTLGVAEPGRTLILDANKNITGIQYMSCDAMMINGQPLGGAITLGTLTSTLMVDTTDSILASFMDSTMASGTLRRIRIGRDISADSYIRYYYNVTSPSFVFYCNNSYLAVSQNGKVGTSPSPNGTTQGLLLNGTLVTSSVTELNYCDVAAGVGTASKALVLNSNKDISGINSLTASEIHGEIHGSYAYSSFNTFLGFASDSTSSVTLIYPNTGDNTTALYYFGKSSTYYAYHYYRRQSTYASNYGEYSIVAPGNLLEFSSTWVKINAHNGVSTGLALNGTLVTALPTELSYCVVPLGVATASKILTLDASKNITGVNTMGISQCIIGDTLNDLMPLEVSTGVYTGNLSVDYGYLDSTGAYIGNTIPNENISAYFTARLLCTEVNTTSDRRLKMDIKPLDILHCKKFIEKTEPVSFNYKNETKITYGYIAQDIIKAGYTDLVSAVQEDIEKTIDSDGFVSPEGYKFVLNYNSIIPILSTNIKESYAENANTINEFTDMEIKQKLLKSKIKLLQEHIKNIIN